MIVERQPELISSWIIAFFPNDRKGWYRFLPDRFKHVAVFAFSHACRTWVVIDLHLLGTRVSLLPDTRESVERIATWSVGCPLLSMKPQEKRRVWRLGLYCVPFVSHIVGCRGALLPSGLWRSCLRSGAQIISDGKQQQPGPSSDVHAADHSLA